MMAITAMMSLMATGLPEPSAVMMMTMSVMPAMQVLSAMMGTVSNHAVHRLPAMRSRQVRSTALVVVVFQAAQQIPACTARSPGASATRRARQAAMITVMTMILITAITSQGTVATRQMAGVIQALLISTGQHASTQAQILVEAATIRPTGLIRVCAQALAAMATATRAAAALQAQHHVQTTA
jgi:hypothetical protein